MSKRKFYRLPRGKTSVTELPDGKWLVTRPCCGASAVWDTHQMSVHVPHEDDCPYGK